MSHRSRHLPTSKPKHWYLCIGLLLQLLNRCDPIERTQMSAWMNSCPLALAVALSPLGMSVRRSFPDRYLKHGIGKLKHLSYMGHYK